MAWRDACKFVPLGHASAFLDRKVNVIGVILEYGFPKPTRGTDWCCSLRIIDESYHKLGMTVNIFAENAERLPLIAALGDVIQLSQIVVKSYDKQVNITFNKKFSSFVLYKGEDGGDFLPYQVSPKFQSKDDDKMFVDKLRKWLVSFQLHEDSSSFPMLREIKEGYINLACKILHVCEIGRDEWFMFAWDGTDTPSNIICSNLENEQHCPLPLQLETLSLPRELLCTLPTTGSILKIAFKGIDKNHLHHLTNGKWVKIVNMHLEVYFGLWCGIFTPFSKFRYAPNDDSLIIERQRLSSSSFPIPLCITEVNDDSVTPVTLMSVLTHSEVTAKFKCIVRVVAVMPCQGENLYSSVESYRMRLTLEDSTARIHALVVAEDGEVLFDGYPGPDTLSKKLNKILGIAECGANNVGNDTQRDPPWVCVCLKSFYVSKDDVWGTRKFRVCDTKIL